MFDAVGVEGAEGPSQSSLHEVTGGISLLFSGFSPGLSWIFCIQMTFREGNGIQGRGEARDSSSNTELCLCDG